MTRGLRIALALCLFGVIADHGFHALAADKVPYADCPAIAENVLGNVQGGETPSAAAVDLQDIAQHVTCFASVMPSEARTTALLVLEESLGNASQQSSPAGSSGSTSQVSKPAGGTSLIQDAGGFSATNNGSALTFQFAPGDLVQQLASGGALDFCTAAIRTKGCASTWWLKVTAPATLSVTANTTSSGATISGMAAGAGSVAPATLKKASDNLSFGAFTAKYGFLYRNKTSTGTAAPVQTSAQAEAKKLAPLAVEIERCQAYTSWKADTKKSGEQAVREAQAKNEPKILADYLFGSYASLAARVSADPKCKNVLADIAKTLPTVSAFQAAIAAQQVLAASTTPLFGFEYDFTTPSSKPSYHSVKLNFSWQSAAKCEAQVQAGQAKAIKNGAAPSAPQSPAKPPCVPLTGKTTAGGTSGNKQSGGEPLKPSPAPAPASATPSWAISASVGADIYQDALSSAIPSGSRLRDIQAGAEMTRVVPLSKYWPQNGAAGELLSKLGDLSVVGAYYYQDQTSPSILNGPPSSITFNGLPTTSSQVFATRGPINIGQLRFGFGTGTNVNFPIAVSYSNRSDLIVHPFVGVQFGISYDLFGK